MNARLFETHLHWHQEPKELEAFVELTINEGVSSYLEIGSKYGASLWAIGSQLPSGSRIVSVDLPNGTRDWNDTEKSLIECCEELRQSFKHDVRLIWGDSTDDAVVKQVVTLGPFDLVFIDANHTMPYLVKDYANYSPLGRMVAFHDISWSRAPDWQGTRIDVPQFWERVKMNRDAFTEFKFDKSHKNNGIGVLWR